MRRVKVIVSLLAVSALGLLGCDFRPGSSVSWSQSVRTWDPLDDGQCLTVGTYAFGVDTFWPQSQGKASVQMRTEFKNDQEFLPQFFDVNYYLNLNLTPSSSRTSS